MAKGTRICKVCGAEYPYCKTNRPNGMFRWEDVACSPEHGSIYLSRIRESRSKKTEPTAAKAQAPTPTFTSTASIKEETPVVEEPVVEEETVTEEVVEVATEADNTIWVADEEVKSPSRWWTTSARYEPVKSEEEDSDDDEDDEGEDDDSWLDNEDEDE